MTQLAGDRPSRPLRVLCLEDSAADAELTIAALREDGRDVHAVVAEDGGSYDRLLGAGDYDVILADFALPGFDAHRALALAREVCPDTPFICVSGTIGEEATVELLKGGADDCVLKQRMARLPFVVDRTVAERAARRHLAEAERRTLETLLDGADQLRRTVEGAVEAMGAMIAARDPYTSGHERRVTQLAVAMAEQLGWTASDVQAVRLAGLVHDIGKISIPAEILSKPSRLEVAEFELIKCHPDAAYRMLAPIEFEQPVADIVWQHHERLDGSGYPRGLAGEQILPPARVLAVADVVEAMASHRPYRAALGIGPALDEIAEGAGSRYDPEPAEACRRLFSAGFRFAPVPEAHPEP